MGRPKGSKNYANKKRGKNKERLTLSKKLAEKSRAVKKQMRELIYDLWLSEKIIMLGLIASGIQLAYAFAYETAWSWIAAALKAAFVEISVWSLTRAIQWATVLDLKKKTYFLWVLLCMVFLISTRANLQYEYEQKIKAHIPEAKIFNSAVVSKVLTVDEQIDAWLRGGLLPLIVLGLILARRTLATASAHFEQEETKRLYVQLRSVEYRQRKKDAADELAASLGGEV